MPQEVLLEERGKVLLITLNRPQARNAITGEVMKLVNEGVARLDESDHLSVGVLTGAGETFCAGMDLKAFAAEGAPAGLLTFLREGSRKPMIAAVEGYCVAGGLEFALSCDLMVAAENVKIGIPEAKRGLLAGGGALVRLPVRLPYAVAMELALTGEFISAQRAHDLGLIARVTPKGGAVTAALELAATISENAPLSVAASKQVIKSGVGLPEAEHWEIQDPLTEAIFASNDAKEGPKAFIEKRAPNWTGS
jgi:enoyl-CoA hydratase